MAGTAGIDLTADTDSEDEHVLAYGLAASLATAATDEHGATQTKCRLEGLKAALEDSDNEDLPLGCLVDRANGTLSAKAAGPSTSNIRPAPAAPPVWSRQPPAPKAQAAPVRSSHQSFESLQYSQEEAALDAYLAGAAAASQQHHAAAGSQHLPPCSPSKVGRKENVQPWCPSSPELSCRSFDIQPMKRRARRRRSGKHEEAATSQARQPQQEHADQAGDMGAGSCDHTTAVQQQQPQQHAAPLRKGILAALAEDATGQLMEDDTGPADQHTVAEQPPAKRRRRASAGVKAACAAAAETASEAAAAEAAAADSDADAAPANLTAAQKRQRLKEQKEAEKARRQQEREAQKLQKEALKAAEKAAKHSARLAEQQANGKHCEREMVVVIDSSKQHRPVSVVAIAEVTASNAMAYCVREVPVGRAVPTAVAFAFKRRRLTVELAKHMSDDAAGCIQDFEEDAAVPYVLLVFDEPQHFLAELQKDSLAGIMAAAKQLHADCSLGVLVVGLQQYIIRTGRAQHRQGAAQTCWSWQQAHDAMLRLQLSCPALQLRAVPGAAEAGQHVFQLARQLGKQPYKELSRVDADKKVNDSEWFKKARMALDGRGRATEQLAQTLHKMSGMAGAAVAIAESYASLGMLISSYQAAEREGRDATLLTANLMVKSKRVGPVRSRRLFTMLMSEDPNLIIEGEEGD